MKKRLFAGISGMTLAVMLTLAGIGVLAFGPLAHAAGEVDVLVPLNPAAGELPEGITVPLSGPQRNRIFFTFVFRVQVLRVNGSSYEPWATIADPTNRLGLGLATDDDGHIYWAIGALGPGSSPPGIYKVPPHGGMATPSRRRTSRRRCRTASTS